MNKRYDYNDFQKVLDKLTTIEEVAKKYNTSPQNIQRAMNKAGYHISKRKILIISPYKKIECGSVYEVARQLGISHTSVIKALNGETIKILNDLHITLKEEKK